VIFGSKSPHRPPTPVARSASPRCRIQSSELEFFTSHTNLSVATIGCTKGIESQSSDEVRRGTLHGHTPPVSNVFHSFPQLQDHRFSLRGDQPQSGQRMRGSDGFRLFSSSSSGSKTTDDLAASFKRVEVPARRTADSESGEVPRGASIPRHHSPRNDPGAHGIAPHL
jgi:hypothetical protein